MLVPTLFHLFLNAVIFMHGANIPANLDHKVSGIKGLDFWDLAKISGMYRKCPREYRTRETLVCEIVPKPVFAVFLFLQEYNREWGATHMHCIRGYFRGIFLRMENDSRLFCKKTPRKIPRIVIL